MTAALTRLWWRLEDVLPQAEHAMACPTQARTVAQSLALAPHGPALTWTSNGGLDLLTSNGMPGWHHPDGAAHHAEASTWRYRTGRYGTAWRDTYNTAHLPLLTASSGRRDVIDVLRVARHTGHHWVTVDIDPGDAHLIPAHRVAVATHRDQLVPAGTRWKHGTVICPVVGGNAYRARIAADYRADTGAVLARFDRATTEQMINDLDRLHHHPAVMPGEYPLMRMDGDQVAILEEDEHGDTVTYREVDRIPPDTNGLYPLGAYRWPWQTTEQARVGRRAVAATHRWWQRLVHADRAGR